MGFCMEINGDTFLNWLNVQNGILFQMAPAVLLGLYTDVKASAIFAGLIVGYIVAIPTIYVMLFGSGELQTLKGVLTGYFSAPSLASAMNFLTVFIVHKVSSGEAAPSSGPYNDVLERRYNDAEALNLDKIQGFMVGYQEPSKLWLGLAGICLPFTVPWFITNGIGDQPDVGIMPTWAFVVAVMTLVVTGFLFAATLTWKPKDADADTDIPLVDQTI